MRRHEVLPEEAWTELQPLLDRELNRLPDKYREPVVLCDLHEMSYVEAAEVIGCAIGTVRSRLHRARAMLIDKLRGANDETTSRAVNPAGCFA